MQAGRGYGAGLKPDPVARQRERGLVGPTGAGQGEKAVGTRRRGVPETAHQETTHQGTTHQGTTH